MELGAGFGSQLRLTGAGGSPRRRYEGALNPVANVMWRMSSIHAFFVPSSDVVQPVSTHNKPAGIDGACEGSCRVVWDSTATDSLSGFKTTISIDAQFPGPTPHVS